MMVTPESMVGTCDLISRSARDYCGASTGDFDRSAVERGLAGFYQEY
jgi:hypothetical protein